mgnify:CR=1 FL=1
MVSQLMKVPVILKLNSIEQSSLKQLGTVTQTEEGIVVDFIARVRCFGDDETFIHEFWLAVSSLKLEIKSDALIRFDWEHQEKVKIVIP